MTPLLRPRQITSPFRRGDRAAIFYANSTHREALARLYFLVDQQRPLGILTGRDGDGKSTVLAAAVRELSSPAHRVDALNLTGLNPRDFLRDLAARFHAHPRTTDDPSALWQRICDRLRVNHRLGQRTAILLDDADEAESETLRIVWRMLKTPAAGLTVILAADSDRLARLGDEIPQLAELWIRLEPWDTDDIGAYVQFALTHTPGEIRTFDRAAIARLSQLSNGTPRWVVHLAELAWLAAVADHRPRIGEAEIEAAYQAYAASYSVMPQRRAA